MSTAPTDLKQKEFDVLFGTLGELQKGLISGSAKVAGFLLLGVGWLVTSKASPPFLNNPWVRGGVAVALFFSSGFYCYGAWMVYKRSQKIFNMLKKVNLMPVAYYENCVIDRPQIGIFIGGILFLSVLLSLCVWASESKNAKASLIEESIQINWIRGGPSRDRVEGHRNAMVEAAETRRYNRMMKGVEAE